MMTSAQFIFDSIAKASSLPVPTAPYVPHSDTSREAAEQIIPKIGKLQGIILEQIRKTGLLGATDLEIQNVLDMDGNTERPRRRELEIMGKIVDSGLRRKTATNRNAVVWIAKEFSNV